MTGGSADISSPGLDSAESQNVRLPRKLPSAFQSAKLMLNRCMPGARYAGTRTLMKVFVADQGASSKGEGICVTGQPLSAAADTEMLSKALPEFRTDTESEASWPGRSAPGSSISTAMARPTPTRPSSRALAFAPEPESARMENEAVV